MRGWFAFLPHEWATVAIAVSLMVFFLGYVSYGPLAQLKARTGKRLPESRMYNSTILRDYLDAAGKEAYRHQLWWDMGFALLYGAGLFAVLDGTFGWSLSSPHRYLFLGFVPVAATAADLLEDASLLALTAGADDPSWDAAGPWLRVSQTFTALKLLFVAGSIALVAVGAAWLGARGAPV